MNLSRGIVLFVLWILSAAGSQPCPDNCKVIQDAVLPMCNIDTGVCSDGCKPGHYGTMCNIKCDINCQQRMCQQGDGFCKCLPGFTFITDSCEAITGVKCISNYNCFNNTCISDSRDDCLEGCKPGWFGKFCHKSCSPNCLCEVESGKCNSCSEGWYGTECMSRCSPGCMDNECHMHGTCVNGCITGSYRERCDMNCSRRCVSGCDQLTGDCVQCEAGRYGSTCQSECSGGCAGTNRDCDRDGNCTSGCIEGFYGEKCFSKCSAQCYGDVCDPTTGHCTEGCDTGYFGSFCNHKCKNCNGGNCDMNTGICTGTKNTFQGTWIPYIIGGGVVLTVVVFAVFIGYCFKRVHDVVYIDVKWRRRPANVTQNTDTVIAPGYIEHDNQVTIGRPTICQPRSTRRPGNVLPRHHGSSASRHQIQLRAAPCSDHEEDILHSTAVLTNNDQTSGMRYQDALQLSEVLPYRPNSYDLPNYCEVDEDLIAPLPTADRVFNNRSFSTAVDVHGIQHPDGCSPAGGEISIPLIAECFNHIETEDSASDEDFRPENYDHPFKDYMPSN